MNTALSDLLVYVLIFASILVFNYFLPRIARWMKAQEELARATVRAPARPRVATDRPPVETTRSGVEPRAEAVPAAPRSGSSARAYLADRSRLRQAIVVAAVLGPCRAQELSGDRDYRKE